MAVRAFITDVSGLALTPAERAFLRDAEPWGLILFKRNIDTPGQVAALTASFREALGRDAPVLVDQEGGRVARLGPPHWPAYPAGAMYGRLYDGDPARGLEAARLGARLIASDLKAVSIDVDCLPIADVPTPGADPVIGDRAYGDTAAKVAAIGAAVARGLMEGGVLPVLKHLPGHGRATADSHERLPVVTAERTELDRTDFAAFRPLAGLPLGMTAHVVFAAYDRFAPATTSATMVREVIRESIGFAGALMSDDLSMGALSGSLAERARATYAAGCDLVLHCNASLEDRQVVAGESPPLDGKAALRTDTALHARATPGDLDIRDARRTFAALLNGSRLGGTGMAS